MRIHLITIGNKTPDWVNEACNDYLKRFTGDPKITLLELPLAKRGKNPDIKRLVDDEGKKILSAVHAGSLLVVLDVKGSVISTEQLSEKLNQWMQQGRDVVLVIGGPDGLSDEVLQLADLKLSFSALTFPHTLIRVMLVEQLYRAWSILNNHPYHRA